MKGIIPYILVLSLMGIVQSCGPAGDDLQARSGDVRTVRPFRHQEGRPFRIAVVQSGDYFAYNDVLGSIHDGLADLGWTSRVRTTEEERATIPGMLRSWQDGGPYVDFPSALYVDLNWTEEGEAPDGLRALLDGRAGADLVISLGTLAGTLVAKESREGRVKVPVMVESVSDPLGSHIIDSLDDSGHDLLTSSSDPEMYERQVRLFHQVTRFTRLGLIYTDTETGRAYAALPTVTRLTRELDFKIVADTDVMEDPSDVADIPKAENAYVAAMERIAPRVDGVYLTAQAGLTPDSLPRVLAVARKWKIPTFIMEGPDFVRKGTLLGESASLIAIEGLYSARKLVRILAGESPRRLPQSNPHVPHIAVNLDMARDIGLDIPVEILLSADEVFTATDEGRVTQ